MAMKQKRECDIYGTYKGVEPYRLLLTGPPINEGEDDRKMVDIRMDLSPRALERAMRGIERFTLKPGERPGESPEETP